MKFSKVLTASAVVLLGLTSVNAGSVFAADNDNINPDFNTENGATNATFNITNGGTTDDNALKLVNAPSLNFGDISMKNVVTNKKNGLAKENGVTGDIQVDNYALGVSSWKLSAKAGIFSGATEVEGANDVKGAKLTLGLKNPSNTSSDDKPILDDKSILNDSYVFMISETKKDILTSGPYGSFGENHVAVDTNNTGLDLTDVQDKASLKGSYSAQITWELTNTTNSPAAK